MEFIKAIDNLPKIIKIIFALPVFDIIWAIYRIVKGVINSNPINLVAGILWIFPGSTICWALDIVFLAIDKKPLFSE